MDDEAEFVCGYCGQMTAFDVDPFGGSNQSYVEDCQVCCRPHRITVTVDPETLDVRVDVSYEG